MCRKEEKCYFSVKQKFSDEDDKLNMTKACFQSLSVFSSILESQNSAVGVGFWDLALCIIEAGDEVNTGFDL